MPKLDIVWQAPEFEYREKDVSWYWISVIVAVLLLSAAVWQKNFLFGFFIIVAEILVLVWGNQQPHDVEFRLDDKGLTIRNRKLYPYREIEAFAVNEAAEGEWTDLVIRFRKRLRPHLKIPAPRQRLDEIEKALLTVATRMDFEESLIDTFERLIGF